MILKYIEERWPDPRCCRGIRLRGHSPHHRGRMRHALRGREQSARKLALAVAREALGGGNLRRVRRRSGTYGRRGRRVSKTASSDRQSRSPWACSFTCGIGTALIRRRNICYCRVRIKIHPGSERANCVTLAGKKIGQLRYPPSSKFRHVLKTKFYSDCKMPTQTSGCGPAVFAASHDSAMMVRHIVARGYESFEEASD